MHTVSSSVPSSSPNSSAIPCWTSSTSYNVSLLTCWVNRNVTATTKKPPNPSVPASSTLTSTCYAISSIAVASSSSSPTYVALSSTSMLPITTLNIAVPYLLSPAPC